jgi:hypothetical protein
MRPTKSATLEGPLLRRHGEYRVVKTKNTLEVKPQEYLTERKVEDLIRTGKIDLTIVSPKK